MPNHWNELSECGERVVKAFGSLPFREGSYVRVRPPNASECDDVRKDRRVLKFLRVGMRVDVTEDGPGYLSVRCGGDTMLWARREFVRTFVRLVEGDEFKPFPGELAR
jgi:hypothetical protein